MASEYKAHVIVETLPAAERFRPTKPSIKAEEPK